MFTLIADYVPDASGRYRIFRDGDIHVTAWGDGALFDETEGDWLAHRLIRAEQFDSFDTDRASGYLAPEYAAWEVTDPETDKPLEVLWIGTEAYTLGETLPEEWRPEMPERTILDGEGQTVSVMREEESHRVSDRVYLVIAREEEDTRAVADLRPSDMLALAIGSLPDDLAEQVRAALTFHAENADLSGDYGHLADNFADLVTAVTK